MLDKRVMKDLIAIVLRGGADFVEVFCEYTKNNVIAYSNKKIESVSDRAVSGVGIRAFVGTNTFFASTTDMTPAGLKECANRVAQVVGNPVSVAKDFYLTEQINKNINPVRINPFDVPSSARAEIVKRACATAYAYDPKIIQVSGNLVLQDKSFVVATSEGLYTGDRQIRTRIAVSAVSSDGRENQSGSASPGRSMGLELFDMISPESVGEEAARQAMVNLSAVPCP